MTKIFSVLLVCSAFLLTCCKPSPDQKAKNLQIPANAAPVQVQISHLNCWTERGQFYVTGICNSQSDQWQKIWLRMEFLDSNGKAVSWNGDAEVIFPIFSAAAPPRGRSAFFQGWPLGNFSEQPDTCRVVGAVAVGQQAGPVLLVENLSGVRMLAPASPGSAAAGSTERGWQISAELSNPLERTAEHPRLELLLFGNDQRLWFAALLNPEDTSLQEVLKMETAGPLPPGSKRRFGTSVDYLNLPQTLQTQKIGRMEMLAFEDR